MKTLIDYVVKWNNQKKDYISIIDRHGSYTYNDLYKSILLYQKVFCENAINNNSIVLLQAEKSYKYVVSFLALSGLGACVVPVPNNLSLDVLNDYITVSDANIAIVISSFKIDNLIEISSSDIYVCNELKHITNTNSWQQIKVDFQVTDELHIINRENTNKTYFNLTSGSTSRFKVAEFFSWQIVYNAINTNKIFELKNNTSYFCAFAAHLHSHELFARPLVAGTTTILWDNTILPILPKMIEKYRIKQIVAFPSIYKFLIDHNISVRGVEYCIAGGEKMTKKFREEFYKLNKTCISVVYGSTETCGTTFYTPKDKGLDDDPPIGIPIPGYSFMIDHDTQELMISGKCCIDKYRGESNSLLNKDGFMKTNDLVYLKNNCIFWAGRNNTTVKIFSVKVSLSLIEDDLINRFSMLFVLKWDTEHEVLRIYYENKNKLESKREDEISFYTQNLLYKTIGKIVNTEIIHHEKFELNDSGKTKQLI